MNSLNFEEGEIIVAPIQFSNYLGTKLRPAIVLSTKDHNTNSDDIVVLKITSKLTDYPSDVPVSTLDLSVGNLKESSVIQVDFPITLDKETIIHSIGKIFPTKLKELKQKIKEFYEL